MSSEKLVPELRFPEFTGNWNEYKLADVTTKIGSGKTPRGGDEVYELTGIPFIRSQNVIDNLLILDSTHIPVEVHEEMSGSKVIPNDILLNITGGSIGRSCVVPDWFNEGNVNQHVCIIRLKSFNSRFLQPFLSSWKGQKLVYQTQTGSGREGLNFESIKGFKIKFPSNSEQTKIANFLSAVDKRISLLTEKQKQLELYKKGLMQQIFSQQIRFKQEDGTDFPDWEEKRLGEIGDTFNGLTGKTKEDFGEGKRYIQYKQIFDKSYIVKEKCGLVSILESDSQNKCQYGDMFFTVSSETPNEIAMNSVLLEKIDEDIYLNSFCFGYRVFSFEDLVPEFAQFFFRSSHVRSKLIKLAQGSTRYNMSKNEFVKLKFYIPRQEEQTKIANFLSALDKKIEQVSLQIEGCKEFKKGLLQKMFV